MSWIFRFVIEDGSIHVRNDHNFHLQKQRNQIRLKDGRKSRKWKTVQKAWLITYTSFRFDVFHVQIFYKRFQNVWNSKRSRYLHFKQVWKVEKSFIGLWRDVRSDVNSKQFLKTTLFQQCFKNRNKNPTLYSTNLMVEGQLHQVSSGSVARPLR